MKSKLFLTMGLAALLWCPLAIAAEGDDCIDPPPPGQDDPNQDRSDNPAKGAARVDVVFVLDTTGSMGSLIEGAKLKVWSISEAILNGVPAPQVRIGLVGYRDVGDTYVTKCFDFSDDMDEVYKNLLGFKANGGGDGPEHVNRALTEAVKHMSWDKNKETLRLIFLVGDAPPHVDYEDGYDYKEAAKLAVLGDICINTIQCGGDGDARKYWTEIAKLGGGSYAAILQSGGMRHIETPYDEKIAALSTKLHGTSVAFDRDEALKEAEGKGGLVGGMSAPGSAGRAGYMAAKLEALPADGPAPARAKAMGFSGEWDLISAVEGGKKLKDVEEDELPEELKKMTGEERETFVAEKIEERKKISGEMAELSKQRGEFIKKKLAEDKDGVKDSFDAKVVDMIRASAEAKGIKY